MSSEVELSRLLNELSIQFNRYFSIIILLFGTIGNLLNCLVLSQPSLRLNPCAYCFLLSSIANLISICFGLTTRILSGWHLDFTNTNTSLCKIRVYIMLVSRTIAFWLIALATFDRWCSSCHHYQRRKLSSLRNAQRVSILFVVCCSLIYSQVLYCYEANIFDAPLQCYGKDVRCRLITDIIYASITILCPILTMFIFGLMTISNVRQISSIILLQRQTIPNRTENQIYIQQERWRKLDRYLLHVLFRQIILLVLLTIPQVIEKLYTTLTMSEKKLLLHISMDHFLYNFVLLLSYAASGMPFYIYTLSGGRIFRNTLRNLLQSMFRR
ncbi:hypothetical protein I4U23_001269 [Adineta vaga]|nr:hypothetical protein I4U23_001269 [Adineta vaga]